MWFKAGAAVAVLLTLCAGLWWVKSRLDLLQTTQARLAQVEAMLIQSRQELDAERLARKLDAQENTEQYEKADWACRETVRTAVKIMTIKPTEVPRYDEAGDPNPMCPTVLMSDIQSAGSGPFVSGGSDGKSQ